jgi:hypothetical protein
MKLSDSLVVLLKQLLTLLHGTARAKQTSGGQGGSSSRQTLFSCWLSISADHAANGAKTSGQQQQQQQQGQGQGQVLESVKIAGATSPLVTAEQQQQQQHEQQLAEATCAFFVASSMQMLKQAWGKKSSSSSSSRVQAASGKLVHLNVTRLGVFLAFSK